VDQFFNTYRSQITGAAASQQELEALKKALISTDIGPEEFRSRLGNLTSKIKSEIQRKKESLQTGITPPDGQNSAAPLKSSQGGAPSQGAPNDMSKVISRMAAYGY